VGVEDGDKVGNDEGDDDGFLLALTDGIKLGI